MNGLEKLYMRFTKCRKGNHNFDPTIEDMIKHLEAYIESEGDDNTIELKCEYCPKTSIAKFGGVACSDSHEETRGLDKLGHAKMALKSLKENPDKCNMMRSLSPRMMEQIIEMKNKDKFGISNKSDDILKQSLNKRLNRWNTDND